MAGAVNKSEAVNKASTSNKASASSTKTAAAAASSKADTKAFQGSIKTNAPAAKPASAGTVAAKAPVPGQATLAGGSKPGQTPTPGPTPSNAPGGNTASQPSSVPVNPQAVADAKNLADTKAAAQAPGQFPGTSQAYAYGDAQSTATEHALNSFNGEIGGQILAPQAAVNRAADQVTAQVPTTASGVQDWASTVSGVARQQNTQENMINAARGVTSLQQAYQRDDPGSDKAGRDYDAVEGGRDEIATAVTQDLQQRYANVGPLSISKKTEIAQDSYNQVKEMTDRFERDPQMQTMKAGDPHAFDQFESAASWGRNVFLGDDTSVADPNKANSPSFWQDISSVFSKIFG